MAEYEIAYLHEGRAYKAIIYAENECAAEDQLESLKRTGMVGDEVVARHDACDATVAWAQVRNEALQGVRQDD